MHTPAWHVHKWYGSKNKIKYTIIIKNHTNMDTWHSDWGGAGQLTPSSKTGLPQPPDWGSHSPKQQINKHVINNYDYYKFYI